MGFYKLLILGSFVTISAISCSGSVPSSADSSVLEPTPTQASAADVVPNADTVLPTLVPASVVTPTLVPTLVVTPTSVGPQIVSSADFLKAIREDRLEEVVKLINSGVDINSLVDNEALAGGALHIAVFNNNNDILVLLLDKGANIDLRDSIGNTPLHWAVHMGNIDALKLLITRGADVNVKSNIDGATPLDIAYNSQSPEPVKLLLAAGGVSGITTDGKGPSHVPDQPLASVAGRPTPTLSPPDATPDISAMMGMMGTGGTPDMSAMMGMMGSDGTPDMSAMMGMMGTDGTPDMSAMMGPNAESDTSAMPHSDEAPLLQNLMFQNLGPWDPTKTTFGALKYDKRLQNTVFDDFGYIHNKGQPSQYDNPTFEFKAPADSVLLAPISGVVNHLEWQPSAGYVQDDWEIIIGTSRNSKWGVGIDHIVSIDCDRSGTNAVFCNSELTINGTVIEVGTAVEAGQILGYVGNWGYAGGSGINGRTELTVFKYHDDYSGVTNYCPTDYLEASVRDVLRATIQELMVSYESWDGDKSIYNENEMIAPGCRYSAIIEENEVTTPVK